MNSKELKQTKLAILGNGFDRWLGLPTSFQNYRCFLKKRPEYKKWFSFLSSIFNDHLDYWNDIENGLYHKFNLWLSGKEPFPKLGIEELIELIKEKHFSILDWIKQIRKNYRKQINKIKLILKKLHDDVLFITFNYLIDWYKTTYRRNYSQLHWLEGVKYEDTEIEFGANYIQILKDNSNHKFSGKEKLFAKLMCKFFDENLNSIYNEFSISLSSGVTSGNPIKSLFIDGVFGFNFFELNSISNIYILGVAIEGKQDWLYFEEMSQRYKMFSKARAYTSYYGSLLDFDKKASAIYKLLELDSNAKNNDHYSDATNFVKPIDELIIRCFGKKNFRRLKHISRIIKFKSSFCFRNK